MENHDRQGRNVSVGVSERRSGRVGASQGPGSTGRAAVLRPRSCLFDNKPREHVPLSRFEFERVQTKRKWFYRSEKHFARIKTRNVDISVNFKRPGS